MEARLPKELEDPRTCLFVKGTHTGEIVNHAMKELVRYSDICLADPSECFLLDDPETSKCNYIQQEKRDPPIRLLVGFSVVSRVLVQ